MKVFLQYLSGKVLKNGYHVQDKRYERFGEKQGIDTHFSWSNKVQSKLLNPYCCVPKVGELLQLASKEAIFWARRLAMSTHLK